VLAGPVEEPDCEEVACADGVDQVDVARDDQLAWPTLDQVTKASKAFLDPVFAGDLDATWSPEGWTWGTPEQAVTRPGSCRRR